jgi:O-antigen/teichoic acid export membrane protein
VSSVSSPPVDRSAPTTGTTGEESGWRGMLGHRMSGVGRAARFRYAAQGVFGNLGIRLLGVGLAYLSTIVLARLLGVTGFGQFMFALACLNVLVIPAAAGLEGVLTRELAAARASGDWPLARGLLRFSHRVALGATLIVAGSAALAAWFLAADHERESLQVFWLALLSLPFFALARLRQHALQGLSHVVVGQVPETLLRPVCLVLLMVGGYLLWTPELTAGHAMLAFALANLGAFALGAWLLAQRAPEAMKTVTPRSTPRAWLAAALGMLLVGSMYVVHNQTDTLMLGMLSGAEAVGLYTAANRGAAVLGFVIMAVAATFSPVFAGLHATGDRPALQRAVHQSCRWSVLLVLPGGLVLALAAVPFLRLFGADFVSASLTLQVLTLGHMITATFGPVAILLIMAGHERITGLTVGLTAIMNVALNALLIPRFGIAGAALATSASALAWNLGLFAVARQRLGIVALQVGGRSAPEDHPSAR